jgi:ABC-type transporter Mla subunit MlaD
VSLLAQDERLTRRVGAITLVLLVLAIGFFVFVADRIEWGAQVRIRVYFRHAGTLREGAGLVVAGRTIGTVETIARSPHGAPGPLGGDEGVVAVVAIEAREARRIARGGDVFVASRGPLSERYLELGPAPDPDAPALAEGDEFLGMAPPSLDSILQRTWDNLTTAKQFADEVGPELDALRVNLRQLVTTIDGLVPNLAGVASLGVELDGLVTEARRLREVTLGGDAGQGHLAATLTQARVTVAQARRMLDLLGAKGSALAAGLDSLGTRLGARGPAAIKAVELAITRIRAAIDKVDPLLAKIQDINDRLARGEGSLGRLANDPEFPEDAKELGKIMKRQPWRIIARPKD